MSRQMKNSEVEILGMAVRLTSWRTVLLLLQTCVASNPFKLDGIPPTLESLYFRLQSLKELVLEECERDIARRRPSRWSADVDGFPEEPYLGPHGPLLKTKKSTKTMTKQQELQSHEWKIGLQSPDLQVEPALYSLDLEWSPSAIRKVADTARSQSSSAAAGVGVGVGSASVVVSTGSIRRRSRWRRLLCLGNRK